MDLLKRLKQQQTQPNFAAPEARTEDDAATEADGARRSATTTAGTGGRGASGGGDGAPLRRRSTFKGLATSMVNAMAFRRNTRASMGTSDVPKPQPRMENTFKMAPDEGTKFAPHKVEREVKAILEMTLKGQVYNAKRAAALSRDLSDKIRHYVKSVISTRYKFVCQVMIGQNKEQGLEVASRCVWSAATDNYACITYKDKNLFAIAMVHAVYYE